MANELVPSNPGEFIIYQTEDSRTRVQVRFEGETVWLSQKAMAELFQKDVRTIGEHIHNIFEEGELQPDSVIRNFRITAPNKKPYETQLQAEAEYQSFRAAQAALPQPVDQHFADAIDELKKIEGEAKKKKPDRKKKGGDA